MTTAPADDGPYLMRFRVVLSTHNNADIVLVITIVFSP